MGAAGVLTVFIFLTHANKFAVTMIYVPLKTVMLIVM
jgi:hypothetical protein